MKQRRIYAQGLFYTLAAFLLVCAPAGAQTFGNATTRVPSPTAAGQEIVSIPGVTVPFSWQIETRPYSTNGTQTAFGGSVDTGSRLSVSPQGAGENGVKVTLPSGATGYDFAAYSSTGALTYGVQAPSASTDINIISGAGFQFMGYGGGYVLFSLRGDQVKSTVPFYGTSDASFPSYAEWSGGYGPYVPTYLVNNGNYPVVIGATSTARTGYVIDLAQTVYARGSINGVPGSGTNVAGASLSLAGGQSTGAGAEGVVNLATSGSGATGTALNALVSRVTVSQAGLTVLGTGTVNSPAYSVGGTPGYTGTIPMTAQSLNLHGGIVTGFVNSAGTQVGNP